ncbi:MAG: pyrroline-5-carboxylate reductase [Alphaproteobacteria bacterium]|nr:MAG: pyrroline-5-carboxylate reductase [Alphaproteobacteria bacterium]
MTDVHPLARPDGRILLIGCGNLGGALLKGWQAAGLPPRAIHIVDPNLKADTLALPATNVHRDIAEAPAADIAVLAVKPQLIEALAAGIDAALSPATILVSVAAGVGTDRLRHLFPTPGAIVRAMPNLPASIGQAATVLYADITTGSRARAAAAGLFELVGSTDWVADEGLMHAATAIAGSGSAYIFLMIEELAAAARALGLPDAVATSLARNTVAGASAMAMASEAPAASLREQVTSPGGTTAAALQRLMQADGGLGTLLKQATQAAAERSRELAGT